MAALQGAVGGAAVCAVNGPVRPGSVHRPVGAKRRVAWRPKSEKHSEGVHALVFAALLGSPLGSPLVGRIEGPLR